MMAWVLQIALIVSVVAWLIVKTFRAIGSAKPARKRLAGIIIFGTAALVALDWSDGRTVILRALTLYAIASWILLLSHRRLWNAVFQPETGHTSRVTSAFFQSLLVISIFLTVTVTTNVIPARWPLGQGWGWLMLVAILTIGGTFVIVMLDRRLPALDLGLAARVLTIAVGITVALLGLEMLWSATGNFGRNGWEVYDRPSDSPIQAGDGFDYKGIFGARREFNVRVRLNTLGYHDTDHGEEKPSGVRRILFLGDSYVEALQVPLESTVFRKVQSLLGLDSGCFASGDEIECIALGHANTGLRESRNRLVDRGLAYSPDTVIVEFLPSNDIYDADSELRRSFSQRSRYRLNHGYGRELAHFRRLQMAGSVLYLLDRNLTRKHNKGMRFDTLVFHEPPLSDGWRRGWQNTENAIKEMHTLCSQAGAALVLVIFTSPQEIEAYADPVEFSRRLSVQAVDSGLPGHGWDYRYPSLRMEQFCQEHDIPVINLCRSFAKQTPEVRSQIHWQHDGHWSETGHRLAAEVITDHLRTACRPIID